MSSWENHELPVNPTRIEIDGDDSWYCMGLTKREHFAAMAMQGIMANEFLIRDKCSKGIAIKAVYIADALLKELSK